MSSQTVSNGDCITIEFTNPYTDDSPDTYVSFDETTDFQCLFSSGHMADCYTLGPQTMMIKFTEDSSSFKITGQTSGKPFTNAYSSRTIREVWVSHYDQCDMTIDPLVKGETSMSAFQQRMFQDSSVSFTSSSEKIAVTDANLIVSFIPETVLKATGRISVQVPAWYTISEENNPPLYSSESMLDFGSQGLFESHPEFEITDNQFDASTRSLLISYTGPADVIDEEVTLRITDFKNPVNKKTKSGFRMTTQDSLGYMIDQTNEDYILETEMTILGELNNEEIAVLGDEDGNNQGTVSTYNKIALFMSSYIPFEQYCFFKFIFPPKLQIDVNLSIIEGEGFFRPSSTRTIFSTSEFIVDEIANTVYIEGCRTTEFLSSRPFGVIYFGYIQMPDYIVDTKPFKIYGYSDSSYQQAIFAQEDEEGGIRLTRDRLAPGPLELLEFTPSNYYAFVPDVTYTAIIKLRSLAYPSTRIILTMPPTLTFNEDFGCIVTYTPANCELNTETNELTLTEIFDSAVEADTILKFIIEKAINPTGSQQAGRWGARTERIFDGQYYTVDAGYNDESFFALSGWIQSSLTYDNIMTFNSDSVFQFTFDTEHDIPFNGYLTITLPEEMRFPQEAVESQQIEHTSPNEITFESLTETTISFRVPNGLDTSTRQTQLTISNIVTPRSFRPSSGFTVYTKNEDGFIVDSGGQDITVTMSEMNQITDLQIEALNKVNGAVSQYKFTLESSVWLRDGDIFYVDLPEELSLSDQISCSSNDDIPVGVLEASCSGTGKSLQISFDSLGQETGTFEFIVDGIINAPSFRQTSAFSNIYMKTFDYFDIQMLESTDHLTVANELVANIIEFSQLQGSEQYGATTNYHLYFRTRNQITSDGTIKLTWSEQVEVAESVKCTVETYRELGNICDIDFGSRTVIIHGAFIEVDSYMGPVTIVLSEVTNPMSNIELQAFVIETFDDFEMEFAIDILHYYPQLVCNYPCFECNGQDKDFCTECWPEWVDNFLMSVETWSTCKDKCDDGYTTNGNPDLICQECDASCSTCEDNGIRGDAELCVTCHPDYDLFDAVNGLCLRDCPTGQFKRDSTCYACSSNCLDCEGSDDACTSCVETSSVPFLVGNSCQSECPYRYGSAAGVCFPCEEPCDTCSSSPQTCTSCMGVNGLDYLWGPTCVEQCPNGAYQNEVTFKCEGCPAGCYICDPDDQRICLQCELSLMLYTDEEGLTMCTSDCPPGYFANYSADTCKSLDDVDVRIIYFPFLIIMLLCFALSYVGSKQKKKHELIPNFIVMMGIVEHVALVTQIILTFMWGNLFYSIFSIIFWACYVVCNVLFQHKFKQIVIEKDKYYKQWRERPENRGPRRLMNVLGLIFSWKEYKLTYSGFWGYRIKPARFSSPGNYRELQRKALWFNIIFTYAGMLVLCGVGLGDLIWGTQLYIMMIENIIICIVMMITGFWEQHMQKIEYLEDRKWDMFAGGSKGFNVMSILEDEEMPEFQKTKEALLKEIEIDNNELFVQHKFTDLLELFGGRHAKSMVSLRWDNEEDPRQVKTWPPSPNAVAEEEPPEAIPDPFPDCVYSQALTKDQLKQMTWLGKNCFHKAVQAGGWYADELLRADTKLVIHKRELLEVEKSMEKKKHRGRKNRYFKQIDNEDNDAGVLLDSDDEGAAANIAAKNELLEHETKLELMREEEEKQKKKEQAAERRAEQKAKAMELTSENLRLKKMLEDQRVNDARESRDFQRRILEEEKERQRILANIEERRRAQEAARAQIQAQMDSQKNIQDEELNKMLEVNRDRQKAKYDAEKAERDAQFEKEKQSLEMERVGTQQAKQEARITSAGAAPSGDSETQQMSRVKHTPMTNTNASQPDEIALNMTSDSRSQMQPIEDRSIKAPSDVRDVKSSPGHGQNKSMLETEEASAQASVLGSPRSFNNDLDEKRTFNEIDIIGDLDRDDRGNLILTRFDGKQGQDRRGRTVNQYGYLIDLSGNVINNKTGRVAFAFKDLDEKGNIPMPYSVEKFNFNPFDLQGTFFFEDHDDPLSFKRSHRSGKDIDELGQIVSIQGFLQDNEGSILDRDGQKRFDAKQFKQFGGLMPKLYTYAGKTFEIQEVMGVFDRDSNGKIQLLTGKDERGQDVTVDKAGFMVNQQGYIVTKEGHISTRQGKILFLNNQLKNGEFPKIFPFTRFNIHRILGDVEMDPGGQPILHTDSMGKNVDKLNRPVNQMGFLSDAQGNIIDTKNRMMFGKHLLDSNGDIPEIFRVNLLRSDSQSSLSRLMSEIDRDQRFDDSANILQHQGNSLPRRAGASDTSFESMMEDSPSKYDHQNQRYSLASAPDGAQQNVQRSARWADGVPDNIQEESDQEDGRDEFGQPHRRRRRKKNQGYVIEEITGRDIQLASAYGGVAKPRIRKTGPRFATVQRQDRAGLQTSQGARQPANPRIQNLTKERVGSSKPYAGKQYGEDTTNRDITTNRTAFGNQVPTGRTGFTGTGPSAWREQHQKPDVSIESTGDNITLVEKRQKRSAAEAKRKKLNKNNKDANSRSKNAMPKYDRAFEDEFEKLYKKDIDKFIDGSDFEVESLAGFSEISKGTFKSAVQNPRMKGLEKVYLQRLEFQNQLNSREQKQRPKPAVKRVLQDRFNDNPKYISKGEQLKFDIGATGSSSKKKPYDQNVNRSQSSLLAQDQNAVVNTTTTGAQLRPPHTPDRIQLTQQESRLFTQPRPLRDSRNFQQ